MFQQIDIQYISIIIDKAQFYIFRSELLYTIFILSVRKS